MIRYFTTQLRNEITKHALDEYPNECVGIIYNNKYLRLENIHETPETDFRMKSEDYLEYVDGLQAIIHSHNNFYAVSKKDMEAQINTAVPWGVANVRNKNVEVFFFGDQLPKQDLIGRPFIPGVYDCYSLARDYYKVNKIIDLPNVPRDYDYWSNPKGDKLFENEMAKLITNGKMSIVNDIKDIQKNDGLLCSVKDSKIINHCAVYLGNGQIINHFQEKLSMREPILPMVKYIKIILRPTGKL
jgi:proteasome lid subunit RPN8/RPN11